MSGGRRGSPVAAASAAGGSPPHRPSRTSRTVTSDSSQPGSSTGHKQGNAGSVSVTPVGGPSAGARRRTPGTEPGAMPAPNLHVPGTGEAMGGVSAAMSSAGRGYPGFPGQAVSVMPVQMQTGSSGAMMMSHRPQQPQQQQQQQQHFYQSMGPPTVSHHGYPPGAAGYAPYYPIPGMGMQMHPQQQQSMNPRHHHHHQQQQQPSIPPAPQQPYDQQQHHHQHQHPDQPAQQQPQQQTQQLPEHMPLHPSLPQHAQHSAHVLHSMHQAPAVVHHRVPGYPAPIPVPGGNGSASVVRRAQHPQHPMARSGHRVSSSSAALAGNVAVVDGVNTVPVPAPVSVAMPNHEFRVLQPSLRLLNQALKEHGAHIYERQQAQGRTGRVPLRLLQQDLNEDDTFMTTLRGKRSLCAVFLWQLATVCYDLGALACETSRISATAADDAQLPTALLEGSLDELYVDIDMFWRKVKTRKDRSTSSSASTTRSRLAQQQAAQPSGENVEHDGASTASAADSTGAGTAARRPGPHRPEKRRRNSDSAGDSDGADDRGSKVVRRTSTSATARQAS